MKISENAMKVLKKRYLLKDEKGHFLEDVHGLFRRVAMHVAQADLKYNPSANIDELTASFYEMMDSFSFMPNSTTLMNAGKPVGQLSACFVLPIEDSMEKIFDAVKYAALIQQSGGGTGFSFSRLRRKGATVRSTGGVASGPVSFMKVFNAATEAVKQGGTRRGANMGVLRVDHPDIIDFIKSKQDNADLTNFNISIGITDDFMQAVKQNTEYALIDPHSQETVKNIGARGVFDLIVNMAWKNGEPGILYLDRINQDNPVPSLGEIESTNPCGEQPLLPFESCNLGSINLDKMLLVDENGKYHLDHERFEHTIQMAVHFLDNVIDANQWSLRIIEETSKKTRKIGLGLMGFADMLFKMQIPYNSQEAVQLAEKIMSFVQSKGRSASMALAKTRGAFPLFEESVFAEKGSAPMRNATVTTIAPTGTLSIICGTTSGIEPLFAISYIRNILDQQALLEAHPYFEEVAKQRGFYSETLMQKIAQKGSIASIEGIPDDVKRVFVTAHDITPEDHIRMQSAFQKYTDNAVSKTVNFPHGASREDVRKVFQLAYELGCKGVTIYRDGSREGQVLNIGVVKCKDCSEN